VKLVFYGGGHDEDNTELNLAAIRLTGKKAPSITYIPAASYDAEIDFQNFVREHKKYKIKNFVYFPVDVPHDRTLLSLALKSDIIHLAGGNTFYFLKHLRKSGMIKHLKEFAAKGGVMTGLSAGAIMMTPTVATASFPKFDCDSNDEGITNFKAMGLVKFEFFPHYSNSKRYNEALVAESKKIKVPLYAAPDGRGVVVNGDEIKFVGRISCFFQGKKLIVH
jgi:dipeptidase E